MMDIDFQQWMTALGSMLHADLPELIKTIGLLGVWAIVFAESGLLIGFFLPGDSLLFTAGFLASQGYLDIWLLATGTFICAILGDNVGYATGSRFGRKLFERNATFFFRPAHLTKAQEFYEKHGRKTIVLARFVPIVRTFAPIIAGIGHMHRPTFMMYNVLGGFLWTVGLTVLGFFLGQVIPNVDKYLLPIVLGIIFVSILPGLIPLMKSLSKRLLQLRTARM